MSHAASRSSTGATIAGARRRRGFALLAVMWVLVVVGVLAVEIHTLSRAGRLAADNARAAARARWSARAGLARTLATIDRLLAGDTAASILGAAGDTVLPPLSFDNDGVLVRAVVLDHRARLNLNLGDHDALERLFAAVGLDEARADSVADAVLDWRDADDLHRPRGAEASAYRARVGAAGGPKNAAFDAVEELRTVFGVTPALYARVAPYVTVSGDGLVNVNSAPVPVLVTLPGVDDRVATLIVKRRRSSPFRDIFGVLSAIPAGAQGAIQADLAGFAERVEFRARDVEIVVSAAASRSRIRAVLRGSLRLAGGSVRVLLRVTER